MENIVYSDILEKIDEIIKERKELEEKIKEISSLKLDKFQIREIRKMYKEREKTHRKMIKDLRRIYDDQSGRTVRKSILKTARISVRNGERIDFDKLLKELENTR